MNNHDTAQPSGKVIGKQPCPQCRGLGQDTKGDNLVVYEKSDGSVDAHCFACKHYEKIECAIEVPPTPCVAPIGDINLDIPLRFSFTDTLDRNIPLAVNEKYGVRSSNVARYYPKWRDNQLVGYKVRKLPKDFFHIGEKTTELFGQHLFAGRERMLIITEGEEDALAAYRITKHMSKNKEGYPSVSLPHGVGSVQAVKQNLEWINSFEKVVFALDQETQAFDRAKECCALLEPGKGHIAKFSEKDASDMCKEKKFTEFYQAMWNAIPFKPNGIAEYGQLWDEYKKKDEYTNIKFPSEWGMDAWSYGLYRPALFVLTAGTSVGKSSVLKHLQYHIFQNSTDGIGVVSMEEPLSHCVGTLMGMYLNKRIMLPDTEVSEEEEQLAHDALFKGGRFVFCSGEGIRIASDLYSKIRFMANARDCRYIFVDHITALINKCSLEGKVSKNDFTEHMINMLHELALELKICILLVSHVRKTGENQVSTYETGKVPDEDSMFGSSAIKQYSRCTLALSRNKSEENSPLFIHVLKDTLAGHTGKSVPLFFDRETGWIKPYTGSDKEIL